MKIKKLLFPFIIILIIVVSLASCNGNNSQEAISEDFNFTLEWDDSFAYISSKSSATTTKPFSKSLEYLVGDNKFNCSITAEEKEEIRALLNECDLKNISYRIIDEAKESKDLVFCFTVECDGFHKTFVSNLYLNEIDTLTGKEHKLMSACKRIADILESHKYWQAKKGEMEQDGLTYYSIGDGTYEVKYNGPRSTLESVEIPETINGKPISRISENGFKDCLNLKTIVIPSTVSIIETSAFQNCVSLEEITITEGVSDIGKNAFRNCSSLKSITLPNTLNALRNNAFTACTELKSIIIPISVEVVNSYVFSKCTSLTIYCEHESQPENQLSWSTYWNSSNCPVIWGYNESIE